MRLSRITVGTVTLIVAGTIAAEASAWTRQSTTYTARGPYTTYAAGGCVYATCGRTATTYGPYGGTVSRTGSTTRVAPGVYAYDRTVVGPYGGTASKSGVVTVMRRY